jgi:ubiquinone/menaquinone biosynthesis C-methylase UbiE
VTTSATIQKTSTSGVDIEAFKDRNRPMSWSSQMIALIRAGHYREGYEILSEKMPFVESQLRPYAERLAGQQNYWTGTFDWINRHVNVQAPGRILDVGCGVGPIAIEFARMGHRTWGIDILPNMIQRGRELAASLDLGDQVELVEGDIRRLGDYFDRGAFDAAVACDIFEHLDDASLIEVLDGLARVVRPGGAIVIQTSPGRHYYWFEPTRWKLLALLAPLAWLPDAVFTHWVRVLERTLLRNVRHEHVRFYRHEYGHINCMDRVHLARLMKGAGLQQVRAFAVHAHPGFKDEGCRRTWWTRALFGRKSAACRNVVGIATAPSPGE